MDSSKKQTTKALATEINNFDLYYEMSDSSGVYNAYTSKKECIKNKLKTFESKDIQNIVLNLNYNGRQCWDRYFKLN